MTELGFLPGASTSTARRVSADGAVVVGVNSFPRDPPNSDNLHTEGFVWTESTGMVSLGDLPGGRTFSTAHDVSADGSAIVGVGETSFDGGVGISEAFYWTADLGMVNLQDLLLSAGATGLDGWTLTEARGVSYDGLTVVGTGVHNGVTEAFVATIPEPSTIVLAVLAAAAFIGFYLRKARRLDKSRSRQIEVLSQLRGACLADATTPS